MKKSLINTILSFLIILFVVNTQTFSQTVSLKDNISNIEISKGEIKKYLKRFEPMDDIEIVEMEISGLNNKYYLLVKCTVNQKENWIYIIQLKSKKKKLVILKGKLLNACEGDVISIDNFNIIDGKINGCVKSNHKIMGY